MSPQTSASSFLQKLAYLLPFLISLRNGIPKNKKLEIFLFFGIIGELKFEPKMPSQTSASSFLQKLAYLLPFLISLRNGIPKSKKLEIFYFSEL